MAIIVDRRKNGKSKSVPNRKRFIERFKSQLRKAVNKAAGNRTITDMEKGIDIVIDKDTLREPTFEHDPESGNRQYILPGNDSLSRDDTLPKPPKGSGRGAGTGPDYEEDFTFTLTKDEFLDIYFSDMELPDFIKQGLKDVTKYIRKKAGYSKDGPAMRLNLKKTFEHAIGRKFGARASLDQDISNIERQVDDLDDDCPNKIIHKKHLEELKARRDNIIYLDDTDIRYDYYTKKPLPIKSAVMFCIMDVSGSMGHYEKDLAKRFFLLLYLFLHKEYETVSVRFITHTTDAKEVDENTFFYSRETGGTIVSRALELVNMIIDDEYDLYTTNIYIAQSSDGDNWIEDNPLVENVIVNKLLDKVQYFAYLEVSANLSDGSYDRDSLFALYLKIAASYPKFNLDKACDPAEVFPVLKKLFKKG